MKLFAGRTAFITGGASGIGLGLARNFLALDMRVVILDHNREYLAQARDSLAVGNRALFLEADVGDRTALRDAAGKALAVFGRIHVLCNNAGVGGWRRHGRP